MQIQTIKEKYNAEIALIILCCRQYIQSAENNSIQLFLQENRIDWKQFYHLSTVHRIRPVVYHVLDRLKEFIKPENLLELRNYCLYVNAFALNNKRELDRILGLLKQSNILARPYKGVDFAENIYGNIGIREFSDNDLIIQVSDIDKLIPVMIQEGYHAKALEFYKKFSKQYIRDNKDLPFEKWNGATRDFAFEFHFKTTANFQGYPFTFAEVLGHDYLREKNYDTNQYLKLMTISNGLMDYYPNLRSILDLAVILKRGGISIINHTDTVLNPFLNYGIKISSELFNYPAAPLKANLNLNDIKFCNYLQNDILEMKEGKRKTIFQFMYYNIKNSSSIKRKISLVKNFILFMVRPNLNDLTAIKLPSYSLYYATKPFRLLFKFFRGGFRSFRG